MQANTNEHHDIVTKLSADGRRLLEVCPWLLNHPKITHTLRHVHRQRSRDAAAGLIP